MEYIVGQTLQGTLAAGGMLTTEALRIAGEIAEVLEAAHAKRIVHRDLKLANVMLTAQGRVKVMDFGLAKQLGAVDVTPDASGVETRIDTVMSSGRALTEIGVRVGTHSVGYIEIRCLDRDARQGALRYCCESCARRDRGKLS